MHSQMSLAGLPVSYEKRNIRFVIPLFSKFEKSEITFVNEFFMHSQRS